MNRNEFIEHANKEIFNRAGLIAVYENHLSLLKREVVAFKQLKRLLEDYETVDMLEQVDGYSGFKYWLNSTFDGVKDSAEDVATFRGHPLRTIQSYYELR